MACFTSLAHSARKLHAFATRWLHAFMTRRPHDLAARRPHTVAALLLAALSFISALLAPYTPAGASSSPAGSSASSTTASSKSTAAPSSTPKSTAASTSASGGRGALIYPEAKGVVSLSLGTITSRITYDNEDYKVSKKRVDIYQRKLAAALHDKYVAENILAPQAVFATQRVAHEKQLYTDWRTAELELERYQNDMNEKLDKIKSSLKKQYTDILDLENGMKTLQDETAKLDANISQLTVQISVGVAKASDMDAYSAQKAKLKADIAAKKRDIDLAKFNLKTDLKISQEKDISLEEYTEVFIRFDDARLDKQIKSAVDNSFSIYSNKKKLEILKDERAIMLQWDREGAMLTNLQNNEISVKETEYALANAGKTEESSLWADYYSLLNQEDQIEVERLNLKVAENDYNVAAAKLSLGLVKPIDEQNALIALENAKAAVQTAINNYMRMSEDYKIRLKK